MDLVLFGGTGDLVMRKLLPALYCLQRSGLLSDATRIVGVARSAMTRGDYTQWARDKCAPFIGEEFDQAEWDRFAQRLDYARVDAMDEGSYGELAHLLATPCCRVFYLSTAPNLFTAISRNL